MALGATVGREVVRINLSEQTDIMDLLGSDLPVEGGKGGEFAWRDGVLLSAIKSGPFFFFFLFLFLFLYFFFRLTNLTGSWVLLDELNLASQSVLEVFPPYLPFLLSPLSPLPPSLFLFALFFFLPLFRG